MSDYPSWVKPHLRRRLEEERAAKNPQPVDGLTPTTPSRLSVGDVVRVKQPTQWLNGPSWVIEMDQYEAVPLTVTQVWQHFGMELFHVKEDNGDWIWFIDWIV